MPSNLLPNLTSFLSELEKKGYSHKTVYNYKRDLMVFENFLKERRVAFPEITKEFIDSFKVYLSSKYRKTSDGTETVIGLGISSINRYLSSLRRYIQYLVERGYNVPIAKELINLGKRGLRLSHFPNPEDMIALIESPSRFERNKIVSLRNRAMLEIIFSTGIRISELLNLRLNDVYNHKELFIGGKDNYGRFVYLTPRAQKILDEYLKARTDDLPYLFIPYRGRNAGEKNKKISPNYLQEKIKKYRELLGINIPLSAHSLRHAFATYLAEKGANPAAIQILLGHESLETTTRYVQASDRYAEKIHRTYHPLKE